MENLDKLKKLFRLSPEHELTYETLDTAIDEAFNIGISEAEGVVPEALLEVGVDSERMYGKVLYNKCRQQTLDNIATLKGKE